MEASRFNRKFIFMGGAHRSGTTLLANLLATHPEISGFNDTGAPMDEGQHLQTVYPSSKGWGRDAVGRFAFDPFCYLTERSPLAAPEKADQLFSEWKAHWDISRPVMLEKSPPNIIRMRYLQACFPNAYCILITRHPIAASVATKKWCRRNPIVGIMTNWTLSHWRFLSDQPKLRRSLVVQYEDLVDRPDDTLARIADFVEVEPNFQSPMQVRVGVNDKYFAQWREAMKNPLDRAMAAAARPVMEPVFARFGYSFDEAVG